MSTQPSPVHDRGISRKQFLAGLLLSAAAPAALAGAQGEEKPPPPEISLDDLRGFERLVGIELSDEERSGILRELRELCEGYAARRSLPLGDGVGASMALRFAPEGRQPEASRDLRMTLPATAAIERPASDDELGFLTIPELGALLRARKLSPIELTRHCLERLRRYGDKLLCVVTLTEELALRQAKRAEDELLRGTDRGPLQGIPYGAKDLFAVPGYPTTFGAAPYRDQVFGFSAAAIEKLDAAGAVLCAKLSLGALAMDDVWFRGKTRNPWNPAEGSSGSSAGSASAVAAGLLPFALGTETQGSIVSPAHRCRVTGLRPTFGRVSRHGAMALSWSMDKIGPLARTAADCALVLAAIAGADPRDPASVDRPLIYPALADLKGLKVGFLDLETPGGGAGRGEESGAAFDAAKAILNEFGAQLAPVRIAPLPKGVGIDLEVESAASFDELTRSGRVREVEPSLWPEIFRAHRFVPAVEYVQALRARTMVMRRFEEELGGFDLVLAPGLGAHTLYVTNRTGHPQLLLPFGAGPNGRGQSVSLIGRLYREDLLCQAGWAIQQKTGHWREKPDLKPLG